MYTYIHIYLKYIDSKFYINSTINDQEIVLNNMAVKEPASTNLSH